MFEQGEILMVPFPFSDLTEIKQRPVLVISKNKYNSKNEDIITCGITSNLKDSSHSVLIDNEKLNSGKIPKTSRIKVDKIFTLEQGIVRKKLAKINTETFQKVKEEYSKLI
jgi:mRNA interferase MazF